MSPTEVSHSEVSKPQMDVVALEAKFQSEYVVNDRRLFGLVIVQTGISYTQAVMAQ